MTHRPLSHPRRWQSRREAIIAVIRYGSLAIVLLVALHGVNKVFLSDSALFALDADWSFAFAWNIVLFTTASVLWWRIRRALPASGGVWVAVSALCAALAVEGAIQVHGRLEESLGFGLNLLVIQPVLAIVVVGVFFQGVRRLPRPESQVLVAAAVALVLAQIASTVNGQLDLPYVGIIVFQTLEESLELLTATLLVAAPVGLALHLPGPEREVTIGNV